MHCDCGSQHTKHSICIGMLTSFKITIFLNSWSSQFLTTLETTLFHAEFCIVHSWHRIRCTPQPVKCQINTPSALTNTLVNWGGPEEHFGVFQPILPIFDWFLLFLVNKWLHPFHPTQSFLIVQLWSTVNGCVVVGIDVAVVVHLEPVESEVLLEGTDYTPASAYSKWQHCQPTNATWY